VHFGQKADEVNGNRATAFTNRNASVETNSHPTHSHARTYIQLTDSFTFQLETLKASSGSLKGLLSKGLGRFGLNAGLFGAVTGWSCSLCNLLPVISMSG
jgi:hypothetical protein